MGECRTNEDGTVTVCFPVYKTYCVRVRAPYQKKYTILGSSRSRRKAHVMLAEAMAKSDYWSRGDVLAEEGPMSYYEPRVIVEMVKQ